MIFNVGVAAPSQPIGSATFVGQTIAINGTNSVSIANNFYYEPYGTFGWKMAFVTSGSVTLSYVNPSRRVYACAFGHGGNGGDPAYDGDHNAGGGGGGGGQILETNTLLSPGAVLSTTIGSSTVLRLNNSNWLTPNNGGNGSPAGAMTSGGFVNLSGSSYGPSGGGTGNGGKGGWANTGIAMSSAGGNGVRAFSIGGLSSSSGSFSIGPYGAGTLFSAGGGGGGHSWGDPSDSYYDPSSANGAGYENPGSGGHGARASTGGKTSGKAGIVFLWCPG